VKLRRPRGGHIRSGFISGVGAIANSPSCSRSQPFSAALPVARNAGVTLDRLHRPGRRPVVPPRAACLHDIGNGLVHHAGNTELRPYPAIDSEKARFSRCRLLKRFAHAARPLPAGMPLAALAGIDGGSNIDAPPAKPGLCVGQFGQSRNQRRRSQPLRSSSVSRCLSAAYNRQFALLTPKMLVGESLSRRHSGTIPGETRVAACLCDRCARRSRPVAFRPDLSSTPADQSLATSRDKCRVPAGLGLRACAVAFPVYPRIPVVRSAIGTMRRYGCSPSSASAL
jgi:hypothetical protein